MQASGQHGHAESDIELCIDDGDGVIGASQRVAAQPCACLGDLFVGAKRIKFRLDKPANNGR